MEKERIYNISELFQSIDLQCIAPEDVIRRLFQSPTWFSYVNDRLVYKDFIMPDNVDEDLDTLINWYTNKKSKKVKYSGVKLRRAFLELPPVEQRKVGLALLTGGMTDVEWVCKRLDNYKPSWDKDWVINWHPCYVDSVKSAWIKFKSKFCGRLLVQFIDKEFIQKHLDELLEHDELYFGICRRFLAEPWFTVDPIRLAKCTSINAYLSIMVQTSEGITDETARRLLYQWIATIASKLKSRFSIFKREHIFWRYSNVEHRVIYSWGIDTALYYLLKMQKYDVVGEFLEWDQMIYTKYYSQLCSEEDSPGNQEIFVDVILANFPEEYKYLCNLNEDSYNYAYSAGQPFTMPRIHPWLCDNETLYPPYLNSRQNVNDTVECNSGNYVEQQHPKETQPFWGSEDDFQKFLEGHPDLRNLVEKLELKPILYDKDNSLISENVDDCPF